MTSFAYDIDRIVAALADSELEVRLSAVTALARALGAPLDAGAGAASDAPATGALPDAQAAVTTSGGQSGAAPGADPVRIEQLLRSCPGLLPALVAALGENHKGMQVTAATCLQLIAYQSAAVIPLLRETMLGTPWRAWGAAIVCARMGLWFPEMAGALSGALGSQDRDVRWAAANLLVQLGRTHAEAVATVRGALAEQNPTARKMGAYCLGAMGAYTDTEAALVSALADRERDVRRAAILALDKLPRLSPESAGHIASLREDPDVFVQRTADAVARKKGRP